MAPERDSKIQAEKKEVRVQFRLEPALSQRLLLVRRQHRVGGGMLTESEFFRHMATRVVRHSLEMPFWIEEADHFVSVTAEGDFFYYFNETLHLNQDDPVLTVRIEMKHDKIQDYLGECEGGSATEYLRSRWACHRFRFSLDAEGGWSMHGQDAQGIAAKQYRASVRASKGRKVVRQAVAHLLRYVRFRQSDSDRNDGAWLDIRVPTARLRFVVVVDRRLYDGSSAAISPPDEEARILHGVLTNLESETGNKPRDCPDLHRYLHVGNCVPSVDTPHAPGDPYHDAVALIEAFQERAVAFASGATHTAPPLPERYAFYVLDVGHLAQGERVGVTWVRPDRAH